MAKKHESDMDNQVKSDFIDQEEASKKVETIPEKEHTSDNGEVDLSLEESIVSDEEKNKVDELQNRILRLQADFDNFRRRTRKEAEELSLYIAGDILSKFLPVLDNFERAIAIEETQDAESLKQGLELIYRQFEKCMTDAGVEKIQALGEQFSPDLHEAVMSVANEELPDGQVETVLEEGYKLKDKVIRYSKVRVVNNG